MATSRIESQNQPAAQNQINNAQARDLQVKIVAIALIAILAISACLAAPLTSLVCAAGIGSFALWHHLHTTTTIATILTSESQAQAAEAARLRAAEELEMRQTELRQKAEELRGSIATLRQEIVEAQGFVDKPITTTGSPARNRLKDTSSALITEHTETIQGLESQLATIGAQLST